MPIQRKTVFNIYNLSIDGTDHTNRTAVATYFYHGYQDRIFNGFIDVEIFLPNPKGTIYITDTPQNLANLDDQSQRLIRQAVRRELGLDDTNEIHITQTVVGTEIDFYRDRQLADKIHQRHVVGGNFDLLRHSNGDRQEGLTKIQKQEYILSVRQELGV